LAPGNTTALRPRVLRHNAVGEAETIFFESEKGFSITVKIVGEALTAFGPLKKAFLVRTHLYKNAPIPMLLVRIGGVLNLGIRDQ
jgi:hypothetical protein